MLDPSSRSPTVLIAVKTGATTISQWLAFATNGFSARTVSTACPIVLYIFQFPAITGLRMKNDVGSLVLGLWSWFLVLSLWSWFLVLSLWSLALRPPKASYYAFSVNAVTPGNSSPARNSSVAPPPVQM